MIILLAALLAISSSGGARAQPAPVSSTQTFAAMSAEYQSRLLDKLNPEDRLRVGDNLAGDQLRREGQALTESQAAGLETQLARRPDDVAGRVRLLGFYDRDPFQDDGRPRRKPHTLWLIRALPESALLDAPFVQPDHAWHADARRAWEPIVSAATSSAESLGTAAGSLAPYSDDEAVGWLRRAASLEPRRALWRDMLGEIYDRKSEHSKKWAARALAEFDAAAALGEAHTGDRRPDLVRLALLSGRYERAGKDARALLADLASVPGFQRAEAVYAAEQVLARLRLRDGDLDLAREHMIASCGGAEGSNEYSVHPEPSVALELEKRGRKGALADFQSACARFSSWQARAEDAIMAQETPYRNLELRLVSETGGRDFPLWREQGTLALEPEILFSGKDFAIIEASRGGDDDKTPSLALHFTTEAAGRFTELTTRSSGRRLAIVIDGKVVTAPKILHPITTGLFEITGPPEAEIREMYGLVIR